MPQSQMPQTNPYNSAQKQPEPRQPLGPIVGIVIVIILLALGALYFWGAHLNQKEKNNELPLITGNSAE